MKGLSALATLLLLPLAWSRKFQPVVPVFAQDVLLDTWEPMLTLDTTTSPPTAYIFATNNYGVAACVDCAADPILYRRTANLGKSFETINSNTWEFLDPTEGTPFTADAVVVTDKEGTLYATYMSGWSIAYTKSTDRGTTWTDRQIVSGVPESDKNWIAISPVNPALQYITYNSKFPFVTYSTNQGTSWSTPKQLDQIDDVAFYACGAAVRSDGMVFLAYAGIIEGPLANYSYARVYSSTDNFATYTTHDIDYWAGGQACPEYANCTTDFLNGGCSLGMDGAENVYYVYNGYADHGESGGNMHIFMSQFAADGNAFTTPISVSDDPAGVVFSVFPMIAGASSEGDLRLAWMDNRTGMYNLWYRESDDFGMTWTEPLRMSTMNRYCFQTEDGFYFPYGDYGMLVVDKQDKTHMVWGEGLGHYAGGSVFYATQATDKKDDDDDAELSRDGAIAIAAVISFLGGLAIASVGWYFMSKKPSSETQQLTHTNGL